MTTQKRKSVVLIAGMVGLALVACSKLKSLTEKSVGGDQNAASAPAAVTVTKSEIKGTIDGQPVNGTLSSTKAYFDSYKEGKKYLTLETSDGAHDLTLILPTPLKDGDTVVLSPLPQTAPGQHLELSNGTALFGPKGQDPTLNSSGGFVKITKFDGKVGGKVEGNFNIQSPSGILEGSFATLQGTDVIEQ